MDGPFLMIFWRPKKAFLLFAAFLFASVITDNKVSAHHLFTSGTQVPVLSEDPDNLSHNQVLPKIQPHASEICKIDPLEYFNAEELEEWKNFAQRRRVLSLFSTFYSLILYFLFAFTIVGRFTFSKADELVKKLGRNNAPTFSSRLLSVLARNRMICWIRRRRYSADARLEENEAAKASRSTCNETVQCSGGPNRAVNLSRTSSPGALPAKLFGPDWLSAMLFTWLFLLFISLAKLPLQIAAEMDARGIGLSVYTTASWLIDYLKGLMLSAISLTFAAFGIFGLIRRLPGKWWLALGVPAAAFMVLWGIISPYQARIFYEFSPLEDHKILMRLENLARKKGVELENVHVIDAGRHTTGINAYITGLGPSRELVLYDTALELLNDEELEAVFAHELGHLDREYFLIRYFLAALFMLFLLWFLSKTLNYSWPFLGLSGPGDPRALPFLLLVVSLCFLVIRPVDRALSRHEERLADHEALMLTSNPEAFISMQVKVAEHNRADIDPPPWAVFWFSTHPPVIERIETAACFNVKYYME